MQNIPPNRATGQQPAASTPVLAPPAMRPLRMPVNALLPSSSSSSSTLPPSYQSTQPAALLAVPRNDEASDKSLASRRPKRPAESPAQSAAGGGDKKAKATGERLTSAPAVKQEPDTGAQAHTRAPHIPVTMEDSVDGLLTLALRPAADLPLLEADPLAAPVESKATSALRAPVVVRPEDLAHARELASARHAPSLFDSALTFQTPQFLIRVEQLAALVKRMPMEHQLAELDALRAPGDLLHMENPFQDAALRLRSAEMQALVTSLTGVQRQAEQAKAVAMTQRLQDLPDPAWKQTLELRQRELEEHAKLMTAGERLAAVTHAMAPGDLLALRGAALERGLQLRKALVHGFLKQLQPHERDQALALAKEPATLAFEGGRLDIAIRLRRLVAEEYFEAQPSPAAAALAARTELASALDTTGLAGQPDALVARASLLKLALADVARQRAFASQALGQMASSSASGSSYSYYNPTTHTYGPYSCAPANRSPYSYSYSYQANPAYGAATSSNAATK